MIDCDVLSNTSVFTVRINGLHAVGCRFLGNGSLGSGAASTLYFRDCVLAANDGGILGAIEGLDDGLGSSVSLIASTYWPAV